MGVLAISSASKLQNFLFKVCMYYLLPIWLGFSLFLDVFRWFEIGQDKNQLSLQSIKKTQARQEWESRAESIINVTLSPFQHRAEVHVWDCNSDF